MPRRSLVSCRIGAVPLCVMLVSAGLAGCASTPTSSAPQRPAAPLATIDQKAAWLLRLEQQRVLEEPARPEVPGEPARPPIYAPTLAELLADTNPAIRRRAALAIGRVGMREGLPLLVGALADANADVRATAAFGLGLLGSRDAVDPLRALLADPALEVRVRAIDALGLIGDASVAPAVAQAGAGCGQLIAAIAPDDEEWPKAPEIEVCRSALFALTRLEAFDALAQIAIDAQGNPTSRWWPVAYALARIGDPRAAAYLRPLADGPGVYTASFALRGLAAAKDAQTAPVALSIAGRADADVKLRVAAVRAVGALGDASAAQALIGVLSEPHVPTVLVVEILDALGTLRAPGSFDVLLELLSDRSPAVRAAALAAAAKVDPSAFLVVVSGMGRDPDWSVRAALARVLGTLPAEMVTPGLISLAEDSDARVHGAALEALLAVDQAQAVPRLFAALEAPDFVERATAARLIGTVKPEGGVAALARAYERGDSDTAFAARAAALEGLAAYGDAESIAVLERALGDREWAVRLRAADLLHGLGHPDAEPVRPAPVRRSLDFFSSPELLHPSFSPHAFIETSAGTIEVQLDVVDATVTSQTFVEQARSGFFEGMLIHRVVPGFVVQAGDPRGDGEGGPGYTLRDELSAQPFLRGTLGVALDWRDTGGSQWFITLGPQPHLDGKYTVFGRVVAGQDVLDRLAPWDRIDRIRIWDGVEFR